MQENSLMRTATMSAKTCDGGVVEGKETLDFHIPSRVHSSIVGAKRFLHDS